ncbi:MAG: bifunctional UDP-N-acetylglucosamine diphosphorylase/glucosamine-1-phosphate N-acetyltransferase GlmU [Bacilli bacterium]|jgi:bifunctional UDP-N-acetylglucosamine pyrophosphorylase/glucosamine-1-phosphate N-acetyltransferase|nr:bifunctional UDP-N-acetylglucosamine diphosphorylase/glucosamine-1-phosphate N-acetyltransferase GlmU [Bacilli bacterium]
MEKFAVILAAGKGTRMKSRREDISKVSFQILGQPIVQYVINALKPIGFSKIVTVVGFGGQTTNKIVEEETDVVWQKEQKGTGHAVMMASPLLESLEGETVVCCGDTPLLTTATLSALIGKHETRQNDLTVLTSVLDDPTGYGRIKKENGKVVGIVEQKDCTEEEKQINEVNAGVYVFNNRKLFAALRNLRTDNAAGEYYLTDALGIFVAKGDRVGTFIAQNFSETLGINDRYQLAKCAKLIRERINKALMLSGVSIEDPETTYIAPTVSIGPDTVICPNTHLLGLTTIGENNSIGPDTYFKNVTVGRNNRIIYSHLVDTIIGNETTLGPWLRARGSVVIKDRAHIGNFNELKNVIFGEGSKCAHLSYLGDADIGAEVNVGCGTIIANYDGVNKTHTSVKDKAFIGSGSTIISPVIIGEGAFIAAGSTINKDVDPDAMAIARCRQENKCEYAKTLRRKAILKSQKSKKLK